MNYKAVLGILFALLLIVVPVAGAGTTIFEEAISGKTAADTAQDQSADDSSEKTDEPLSDIPLEDELAPGANNYGYLKVDGVSYDLKNMDADITVYYHMEPWISFLVTVLGKADLKNRIIGVLQYPETGYNQEITFKYLGSDRATVHVTNVAVDNQDSSYWLKPHSFGCTIPILSFIISKTDTKTFTNVKDMARGLGYFKS